MAIGVVSLAFVTLPLLAHGSQLPNEVRMFIRERKTCERFLGEPVGGNTSELQVRQAFIHDSIDIYCAGTDKKLAALRRRYSKDTAVLKALSTFEDKLE